jgi:hypothetical protein
MPAHAGAKKLKGRTFAGVGREVCLIAPTGFNSNLQPNDPSKAFFEWHTSSDTVSLAKDGSGTVDSTTVVTRGAPSSGAFPSGAFSTEVTAPFTSTSSRKDGTVTLKFTNAVGTVKTGPRAGETFTVDHFTLVGVSGPTNDALFATPSAEISTITFSTGETFPAVCHRTVSVLRPQ